MTSLLTQLKSIFVGAPRGPKQAVPEAPHLHVMVPDSVTLPLPRATREEICVPASINGRDLSAGRI